MATPEMPRDDVVLARRLRHCGLEYKIIGEQNTDDLENRVNNAIDEGWIPIGGVSVEVTSQANTIFYQAMTRDTTSIALADA